MLFNVMKSNENTDHRYMHNRLIWHSVVLLYLRFFCCFDYRFIGPNDWIQMKSWNLSQEYANVCLNTQSIELQRKQQSQAPNIVEYIVSISCSFHWNCSQLNSSIAARDDKSSFSIWTWIIIKAFVCLSFKWVLCNVTFDIHVENKYRPFSLNKNDTVVI